MKITGAYIDDPTERGEIDFPQLCVVVDEMPTVTIAEEKFSGNWSVGKYGPFVKYECDANVDAGDFNMRFRGRFPMVVDITLVVVDQMERHEFALPLKRARQIIRKHAPGWRLLLNELAAERGGSFLWLPTQINPACRTKVDGKPCGARPARYIRVSDVDFAMCNKHIEDHNSRHAERRAAQAS